MSSLDSIWRIWFHEYYLSDWVLRKFYNCKYDKEIFKFLTRYIDKKLVFKEMHPGIRLHHIIIDDGRR